MAIPGVPIMAPLPDPMTENRRYLDWLAESEAVKAAYGVWSRAPRTDAAVPFVAYGAALDREERAATVYCSVIDQVEQRFGGKGRLAGAPPGAVRA